MRPYSVPNRFDVRSSTPTTYGGGYQNFSLALPPQIISSGSSGFGMPNPTFYRTTNTFNAKSFMFAQSVGYNPSVSQRGESPQPLDTLSVNRPMTPTAYQLVNPGYLYVPPGVANSPEVCFGPSMQFQYQKNTFGNNNSNFANAGSAINFQYPNPNFKQSLPLVRQNIQRSSSSTMINKSNQNFWTSNVKQQMVRSPLALSNSNISSTQEPHEGRSRHFSSTPQPFDRKVSRRYSLTLQRQESTYGVFREFGVNIDIDNLFPEVLHFKSQCSDTDKTKLVDSLELKSYLEKENEDNSETVVQTISVSSEGENKTEETDKNKISSLDRCSTSFSISSDTQAISIENMSDKQNIIKKISENNIILLLGEGNFSFASEFCFQFPFLASSVFATELEKSEDLIKDCDIAKTLKNLDHKVNLRFEINARRIDQYPEFKNKNIKLIRFNCPFGSGQSQSRENFRETIFDFFKAAWNLQTKGGYVVITILQPMRHEYWKKRQWEIPLVRASLYGGYRLVHHGPFEWNLYPQYTHRVTTKNNNCEFNKRDFTVFVFEHTDISPSESIKSFDFENLINISIKPVFAPRSLEISYENCENYSAHTSFSSYLIKRIADIYDKTENYPKIGVYYNAKWYQENQSKIYGPYSELYFDVCE